MLRTDRPQVAVVGAGYWGKNLVRNFYNLGAIRLVVDKNENALAAMAKNHPGLAVTNDYQKALADPEVAGVVLASPAIMHYEMAKAALLAGKHVFVEKPLALSYSQGAELCTLAADKNLVIMVDHLLQQHPALKALEDLIKKGVLGDIHHIYSRRMNFGKIRREEDVLWSLAPHDLAMILSLIGTMPEKVTASGQAHLQPGICDFASADLYFANRVMAHIEVSWVNPVKEQKLVVVGSRKMAVFDDTLPLSDKLKIYGHYIIWDKAEPEVVRQEAQNIELADVEPLKLQAQEFMAAMAGGPQPLTSGLEALKVLELLEKLSKSIKENGAAQKIGVSDFFAHESAIIDHGVKIGRGTKIWHFSHVLEGTEIGENCNLGQNVVVGPNAKLGSGCKVQNNVSLYDGVELSDHVFCGPSCVFTNVINPRSHVNRKNEYKKTKVGIGASIGANATIVCGHDLGAYCFIGAGAVVTKNVPAHALMVGTPARRVGWVCRCGEKLAQDLTCATCGESYQEGPDGLELKNK